MSSRSYRPLGLVFLHCLEEVWVGENTQLAFFVVVQPLSVIEFDGLWDVSELDRAQLSFSRCQLEWTDA